MTSDLEIKLSYKGKNAKVSISQKTLRKDADQDYEMLKNGVTSTVKDIIEELENED